MKLIIAGGRDFNNYELLETTLIHLLQYVDEDIEIVSGTCDGADKLGEMFAAENNHLVKRFPADWEKYGKSAGPLRNKQMAEYATHCVCFWDGQSKGTGSMIELAKRCGCNTRVIKYFKNN